jgi:hypothetical protein
MGHRLPSTLTGDPPADVPIILEEVSRFLEQKVGG